MNRSPSTRRVARRRGTVAVLVAVSMTLILGLLTLSVESGRLYDLQRREQTASDAAALAAAIELYRANVESADPQSTLDPREVALEIAALNGFPNSAPHQVTVSMPPATGKFAGRDGFIQVEIKSRLPRTFSGIFGDNDLSVQTSSVAGGTQMASKASVLVLEKKKKDALKIKGSSSQLMTAGDVYVNSSSKSAIKLDKKSQLTADALMVVGGMDKKSKGYMDGDLHTGVEPTPDPYSHLTPPAKTSELDPEKYLKVENGRNVYYLPPGTYKELKFEHDDLVVMASGTYHVLEAIDIKGDASVIAHGVTIYTEGKKNIKFNTRGGLDITPPLTGPYAGVSIYVDPSSKKKIEFKKDANYSLHGVIYAPNSEVKFQHTNAILAGVDDEDDSDSDIDYGGPDTTGSIGASLIARKLSIDKHSEVQLLGSDIDAQRPFLGVIE